MQENIFFVITVIFGGSLYISIFFPLCVLILDIWDYSYAVKNTTKGYTEYPMRVSQIKLLKSNIN